MRVLVTGAAGFVGMNLLPRLQSDGHEVHALVRGEPRFPLPGAVHRADLRDAEACRAVFRSVRPEWVFHLATHRGPAEDGAGFFAGNVPVAMNLVEACREWAPERVVLAASSLEYGHRGEPLREDMPARPTTWHGVTRLCVTQLFLQAYRAFALPVVALRVFSVYGPWEPEQRLVPQALLAGLEGRALRLTPPGIRRDYIAVDDVVDALLLAAGSPRAPGQLLNVGTGVQTSNEELVARVNELTGYRLCVAGYDYPPHATDTTHWVADTALCHEVLGWRASRSLVQGLTVHRDWLLRQRSRNGHD